MFDADLIESICDRWGFEPAYLEKAAKAITFYLFHGDGSIGKHKIPAKFCGATFEPYIDCGSGEFDTHGIFIEHPIDYIIHVMQETGSAFFVLDCHIDDYYTQLRMTMEGPAILSIEEEVETSVRQGTHINYDMDGKRGIGARIPVRPDPEDIGNLKPYTDHDKFYKAEKRKAKMDKDNWKILMKFKNPW